MDPFVPGSAAKMLLLAGSGYSSHNLSRYESIPMHSSSFPWYTFQGIPFSSQRELGSGSMHLPNAPVPLTHMHGKTRVSSCLPPFVNGMPSLASTVQSSESQKVKTRKLICGICNKIFLRPSALRVHMRIHSGEKPFQCTQCPRSFSQSGNLTVHMRKHTGERPFTCPVCCKGFSQSNTLKVHIRTHTREKLFQCGHCMKRFADRSSLTKHLRVHNDVEIAQSQDSYLGQRNT